MSIKKGIKIHLLLVKSNKQSLQWVFQSHRTHILENIYYNNWKIVKILSLGHHSPQLYYTLGNVGFHYYGCLIFIRDHYRRIKLESNNINFALTLKQRNNETCKVCQMTFVNLILWYICLWQSNDITSCHFQYCCKYNWKIKPASSKILPTIYSTMDCIDVVSLTFKNINNIVENFQHWKKCLCFITLVLLKCIHW